MYINKIKYKVKKVKKKKKRKKEKTVLTHVLVKLPKNSDKEKIL